MPFSLMGADRQVLERRQVREEVERLEHHVHLLAHLRDIRLPVEDVDAIDVDGPAARMLEQVQAAQEGALAGARRADDGNHLALADLGA